MTEEMRIDQFQEIIAQYQLALKNNENHRSLDYDQLMYLNAKFNYNKGKTKKSPKDKKPKDLTTDRLLIGANMALTFIMFLLLFYVLLF